MKGRRGKVKNRRNKEKEEELFFSLSHPTPFSGSFSFPRSFFLSPFFSFLVLHLLSVLFLFPLSLIFLALFSFPSSSSSSFDLNDPSQPTVRNSERIVFSKIRQHGGEYESYSVWNLQGSGV